MKQEFKPYYVVIFTSTHTDSTQGYSEMAAKMEQLASEQDGFLGIDTARNDVGISNSYWESLEDIKNWKQNADHLLAQEMGKKQWYSWYNLRICKVEREYEFRK
ncbi:MAG: antibiotic biosynthesis monooxygenase [Bacteroidia bacterium]|nr:antibiotic biosynthesis monooxygenase [Bacteroidia bacterium]NND11822.1 antibiotic biosynthesis monooxygenase [Flavobacteriaceae bacterium]MBT8308930.1 antibiotic biosynthesis monooxygenase [Bacteroidia bacterium]NNK26699.1 antibiotic biosynthesis monooxygenase [Flavobacteriaceae bacterium]NNL61586.1 antibiotic biosynthesis monooxygenase [Flavobacteriaceae bacterium]